LSTHIPAAWYPDPNDSAGLRWWDGQAWTTQTAAAQSAPVGDRSAPQQQPWAPMQPQEPARQQQSAPVQHQWAPWTPPHQAQPGAQRPTQSVWHRNSFALVSVGVVAIYLVLALTVGVVFFGILPVLLSIRSVRVREPLAPLAIAAAVVAVVIAVAVLSG
jgi:hypothetical protein